MAQPQTIHRAPGVRRLLDGLERRIRSGDLRPGDYLPGANELAREFGVGYVSVIRVYRTLAAAGLIATVRGRGAFVKEQRPAQVREVVAVLPTQDDFSHLRNPDCDWVFHGLLEGMNGATLRLGLRLQLLFADAVGSRWAELIDGWVPGTAALFVSRVPEDAALRLTRQGRAFALVLPAAQRQTAWEQELPVVMADYRGGVAAAVAAVLAKGRQRPAFLGDADSLHERPRYLGLTDAAAAAGAAVPLVIPCAGIGREAGRQVMLDHLRRGRSRPGFDFLFCGNDLRALGALEVFAAAKITVPGTVAVLGFDDIPAGAEAGLSTVRLPIRALGEKGLEWCVAASGQRVTAPTDPGVLTLPCPPVWRRTTP